MSVKVDSVDSPPIPYREVAEQVQRVLRSDAFKGSEVLRNLLSYLSACTLEGRTGSLKVKEIATAVFGRSDDFDSQGDSVVRVHTGRLRSKLAEYYLEEAAEDEVILSIPKGSYALCWHGRHAPAHSGLTLAPALTPALSEIPVAAPRPIAWAPSFNLAALLVLLPVLSALITWLVTIRLLRPAVEERPKPALQTFWKGFVATSDPPLLVFSNFRLLGTLDTGLQGYSSGSDSKGKPIIDSYTTIGEVMGVFEVSRMLGLFHKPVRAKHGQLLTWDDAKDSNLIFIGGPLAETPLREISVMKEFQFKNRQPDVPALSGAIVNIHSRPGEPRVFNGPDSRPFRFDYAVIALRPAFGQHRTLVLAGITEYGTQGAAEFVTREDHVNELLSKLGIQSGAPVPWFEAVLRVVIERDVPVQYELVAVHRVG